MKSFVGTIVERGVRDRKGLTAALVVVVATGSASSGLLALAFGKVAAYAMGVSPPNTLAHPIVLAIGAMVVRASSQSLNSLLSASFAEHIAKIAHQQVITRLIASHPRDDLDQRSDSVGSAQELLQRLRWNVLSAGVITLGSLVMATTLATIAMVMATRVATIAIALAVGLSSVVAVLTSRNRNSLRLMGETHVEAGRGLRERVELAREARALGALDTLTKDAIAFHDRAADARLAHAKMQVSHAGIMEFVGALALASFAFFVDPRVQSETLATALAALVLLVRPAQSLAQNAQTLLAARHEVERMARAFFESPVAPEHTEQTADDTHVEDGLVVRGLTVTYDGRLVLDAVDLTVARGEVVALLGPSGCGKSTLLECAVGARAPSAGRVYVDGAPVRPRADVRALGLAWAPQRPSFLSESLGDNVDPSGATDEPTLREALREAGLDELLARAPHGIATVVPRAGGLLSAGERARLALARVFVTSPRYLVLDEPTASLDDATEAAILRAVVARARAGAGVLIATHRTSTAAHADRRFRLHDGKLEPID